MDKITLKNFRCFREEQTARLAPLTLLVGENSTGKTSFMALIRALWDVAFAERVPDFREAPYNLGSFRDIVHNRGGRGKPAESFEAGFEQVPGIVQYGESYSAEPISFKAIFEDRGAIAFPSTRYFETPSNWLQIRAWEDSDSRVWTVVSGSEGKTETNDFRDIGRGATDELISLYSLYRISRGNPEIVSISGFRPDHDRLFATAPVRSQPLRTYDPGMQWADPVGENVPTYLASIYHRDPTEWQVLKSRLEDFGRASGLFDEISIKSFGKSEGAPFQLQVRKFSSKGRKGPWRNLIDVGYGVSQSLPLLKELMLAKLFEYEAKCAFLLQQPEVHLHPRAQAALGSLFCQLAGAGNQIIVETHSDYLIDRVRMDVRDKTTGLRPEDVSILYFEPGDLDVKIHSLRLDKMGNVLDAPPSYGQFFMEETRRSIGVGL